MQFSIARLKTDRVYTIDRINGVTCGTSAWRDLFLQYAERIQFFFALK